MKRTRTVTSLGHLLTGAAIGLVTIPSAAEQIVEARYADPVTRYGHFALGRPHEYAQVVALTGDGATRSLVLPDTAVFEDLAPRPVRLSPDGPTLLLAIVSAQRVGARLALLGLQDGRLQVVAAAPPIGTPNRWLNPVGVVDLDGDGVAEVAAVTTPHIGGVLRVYRRKGDRLVEVDAAPGFSNHVYGSPELALSATARIGGQMSLLVPDMLRTTVRVMTLRGGRLVETARCHSDTPVDGPAALGACEARLHRDAAPAAR